MTSEVASVTAALSGDTSAISAIRILRLLLEYLTSDIQVLPQGPVLHERPLVQHLQHAQHSNCRVQLLGALTPVAGDADWHGLMQASTQVTRGLCAGASLLLQL